MIGEQQIYLAHIGCDDYLAVLKNRTAFNTLVRKCGGMPIPDHSDQFCASIAFENRMFRDDFVREMKKQFGVYVAVNFRSAWIDRRFLPPPSARKVADTLIVV